jgi:GNAT superfamily N-acetyltransferase
MEDPLFEFFFPNESTRFRKAKIFFKAELSMCRLFTYCLEDMNGAIIIKKATDRNLNLETKVVLELISTVGLTSLFKSIAFRDFILKTQKKLDLLRLDHLVLICVKKDYRGKGLAKQMIKQLVTTNTYLETQNPINVVFYENLGFQLLMTEPYLQHSKGNRKSISHSVLVKNLDV